VRDSLIGSHDQETANRATRGIPNYILGLAGTFATAWLSPQLQLGREFTPFLRAQIATLAVVGRDRLVTTGSAPSDLMSH
jgi:hypothetical protein